MNKTVTKIATFAVACLILGVTHASQVEKHPRIEQIIGKLSSEGIYSKTELIRLFSSVEMQPKVLNAMKNPAESKFTWGKYRKIFIQPDRIAKGVAFWEQYRSELLRAEQEFGVPAEIIVAIIGVESKFGQYRGAHPVLDTLTSLVVDFPRRSEFFATELEHFLILAKENNLSTSEVKGSYAGAMGYPQFISSSYRSYAVDFNADGITDLIDQPIDAIGSVANYFKRHGWQSGKPVVSSALTKVPDSIAELANRKRKVRFSAAELREFGAEFPADMEAGVRLNVLILNASESVNEPNKNGVYVVRAGDTACQIAETYNVSCRKLIKANKLDTQARIYKGQRLKLPMKRVTGSAWNINADVDERYFYTHENFYVITRYNHSVLYAMAVYELSGALKTAFDQSETRNDE